MKPIFTLTIQLGNADMNCPESVADALRNVAVELDQLTADVKDEVGMVRDHNGNHVGGWVYKK